MLPNPLSFLMPSIPGMPNMQQQQQQQPQLPQPSLGMAQSIMQSVSGGGGGMSMPSFGGFGGGTSAGASSGMSALASPYTALAAIIAGTSAGALSKGHDNQGLSTGENIEQLMGGSGWGGPPMQAFQDLFKGDVGSAGENALASAPGTNVIAPLVNGGSIEDGLKNLAAPVYNLKDIGSDGNAFLDIIQTFASPFSVRKGLKD